MEEHLLYETLSLREEDFNGRRFFSLDVPVSIHPWCRLESLQLEEPAHLSTLTDRVVLPAHTRHQTHTLQVKLKQDELLQSLKQSILGGGLSNLKLDMDGVALEVSGVLAQEGRRSSFWMRGFFQEQVGDAGGFVFTDQLFLGVPTLPSPALVSLLASRVGLSNILRVNGAVQVHINPLGMILKWALVPIGWKIPSYNQLMLQSISMDDGSLVFQYADKSEAIPASSFARQHPAYHQVETTTQSEQMFVQGEAQIRRGNYQAAIQLYEQELRNHPRHPFVQERLMQLYIASRDPNYWQGAYRLAEDLLNRDGRNLVALNCAAQYGEVTGDADTAIYFTIRLAEVASEQGLSTLAALAYAKAAMMLESKDPQQALLRWHASREQDPTYSPSNAAIARHAIKQKRFDEAEQVLQELVELLPEGPERARHHLSLAGLYRSHFRDLNRAWEQLEQAAPHLHDDLAFLRESAEFHLAQREDFEAITLLDRLAERVRFIHDPNLLAMILARTGQVLEERLKQPGMALYRYREALRYAPHHTAIQRRVTRLESHGIQEVFLPTTGQALLPLQIQTLEARLEQEELSVEDEADLYLTLAELYWQQQRFSLSFKNGVRAVQKRPSLHRAWEFLEEIAVEAQQLPALASVHRKAAQFTTVPARTMYHLEEAIRLVPHDKRTFDLLAQVYNDQQEWAKLLGLYEKWEQHSEGYERSELLLRKALLLESTLQRYTQAEEAYLEACEHTEEPLAVLSYLFQFYINQNEFHRFQFQYEAWLEALPESQHARFHGLLAHLLQATPEHRQRALDLYLRALELSPENDDYLRSVLELAQQSDDEHHLAEVLERMSERLSQSQNAIPLLLELLRLLEEETGSEVRQREVCQQILLLNPSELQALQKLAQIEIALEHPHEAVKVLEHLLQLSTGVSADYRFEVLEQLLELYGDAGEEEKLLRTAIEFVNQFPDFAHTDLEEARHFEGDGQPLAVSRLLLMMGTRWRNARYFLYIANILRRSNPDASAIALELGLEIDPLHPDLWRRRLRTATPEDRARLWKQLLEEVERLKALSTDTASWQSLFDRWNADDFSLEEMEQLFEAFQVFGRFPPSVVRLFTSRLESEEQYERSQEIREAYLGTLHRGSEEFNQTLYELSIHQLQILGQREEGLQRLWELVEIAPSFREPLLELKFLYEAEDQLAAYVTQLDELLHTRLSGIARADLLVQAFEILMESGDPEEALQFLKNQHSSLDGDIHSLQALAALYEELGEWEDAAHLYKSTGELEEDEKSIWFFEKSATLYQQELDRPEESLLLYQTILSLQPEHELATESLKEIYNLLWMWDDLAALLEHSIEQEEDRDKAIQYLCELGEIYLGRLEDYDKALDTYRAALRKNPHNLEVLHTLRALYEEIDDWPAVVSAIKLLAKLENDPVQACSYYLQVAELSLDRLYKLEDAEKFNLMALQADPGRQEAVVRLLDLYDASGNWDSLAQLTGQQSIYYVEQRDPERASSMLDRMLSALEQRGAPVHPQEWLEQQIQEARVTPQIRQDVMGLLNGILNPFDASKERPLPLYHKVYERRLTELSWLLRLEHQLQQENSPSSIPSFLSALSEQESWEELARELDALEEQNPGDELAGHYSLAAAQIYWYLFQNRRQALALAKRSLVHGLMPERPLSFIDEVFITEGIEVDPRKTRLLVDKIPSAELQRRAHFHMAHDAIEKMGDWESAIESLHFATHQDVPQALVDCLDPLQQSNLREAAEILSDLTEQHPDNLIVLRLLGAVHYLQAEMEEAAYPLYRFLELAWSDLPYPEVVELCLQLAQVSESRSDLENALFYLQQASQFLPEETRILSMQLQLLSGAGLIDDLRMLLYSHIEEPEPSDDMADLWYQLGRLEEEHYQNQSEAQKCYERALHFAPEHEAARTFFQNLSDSTREGLEDTSKAFTFKV